MSFRFSAILIFLFASLLFAHEGLHEQIEAVTKEIRSNPNDADLYLRRGELFRWHGDAKKALSDYATAVRLNPALDIVDLYRGHLYSDRHEFGIGRKYLDRFLLKHPDHVDGHLTRARMLVATRNYPAAVQDYSEAIRHAPEATPEFFIEKSEATSAQGPAHWADAIDSLDDGIEKLGPLVTLQLPAIDLELKRNHFDTALQRLDTLIAQSERKESWLFQRGQILQKAGRNAEAKAAFESAISAIESLPSNLRETRATQELETQIRAALNQREDSAKPQN
jgi:tetratricopeptide (TPR) repeat protein